MGVLYTDDLKEAVHVSSSSTYVQGPGGGYLGAENPCKGQPVML